MSKMKLLFLIFLFHFFSTSHFLSYAQDAERYTSKDSCIKNFEVENINLNDPFFLEYSKTEAYMLKQYFKCKAAMNYDKSECNKLNPIDAKDCRENYDLHNGYYATLLLLRSTKQPVMRDAIFSCVKDMHISQRECKAFLDAFIKEDVAICEKRPFTEFKNECVALIKLDANLSASKENKTKIHYINAMKEFSIDECKKIQMPCINRRSECEAYITGNKNICEQYPEFRQFRETYCSESIRGKQ